MEADLRSDALLSVRESRANFFSILSQRIVHPMATLAMACAVCSLGALECAQATSCAEVAFRQPLASSGQKEASAIIIESERSTQVATQPFGQPVIQILPRPKYDAPHGGKIVSLSTGTAISADHRTIVILGLAGRHIELYQSFSFAEPKYRVAGYRSLFRRPLLRDAIYGSSARSLPGRPETTTPGGWLREDPNNRDSALIPFSEYVASENLPSLFEKEPLAVHNVEQGHAIVTYTEFSNPQARNRARTVVVQVKVDRREEEAPQFVDLRDFGVRGEIQELVAVNSIEPGVVSPVVVFTNQNEAVLVDARGSATLISRVRAEQLTADASEVSR